MSCTTNDGTTFNTYSTEIKEPLSIANDDEKLQLICGDYGFHLYADTDVRNGEYAHPFFCPYVKNSCQLSLNGYTLDVQPFEFEVDGVSMSYKCVDDAAIATDCDDAALCDDSTPIKPFMRYADEDGMSVRYTRGSKQVELMFRCQDQERPATLFEGGPEVDVIYHESECPSLIGGGAVGGGTIVLAMLRKFM